MKTASPQLFVPISQNDIKEYFASNSNERKDTNIGLLSFNFLKEGLHDTFSAEDLILCEACGAALNVHSKLQDANEEKMKNLWYCEFCNSANLVILKEIEKVKKSDPLYLMNKSQEVTNNIKELDSEIHGPLN